MASPAYKVHAAIEDTQPSFQSLFKVPLSNNALAIWQSDVIKAIEGFLTIIKEKVVEHYSLSKSSLLISYAPGAHREIETGALILKQCFAMVGVSATINAVTTSEALNLELNQHQQAIVLCTPLYAQKVTQDPAIRTVLDSFGKKRSDSLHTILCQGAFSDALKVVDGHFLIRAYQEAFSDNTYNALQTFIDVFLEVSGNQGLGLLPDVLDLEKNEQFDARTGYLSALTVLHQTIIQLTIDYRLRESMEKSLEAHPLKPYLDVKAFPTIKQTPGFEPIVQELLETSAKVSLLLCPTSGDTELASLALTQHFLDQKNLRVLSIECADYPGKAAADCVRLALQELKLKTVHLDFAREKPLIILLKGYEQFGVYDNLIVKNKLPSFADVKVIITCKADFFKFRGYLNCFLSDVSNRRVDDILVHKVPGFASLDAKQFSLSITRQSKVLETTEAVLLSPKRRAQQEELKSFLKNLNQIWVREGYLQADIQQNPQIFISYAWEGDKASLARQQRHLLQLSHDLTTLGFPTWLDIERMTGDINEQMAGNIANSRVVLVIGTPRYTERAAQNTNVQKEFTAISKKAEEDLNFRVFPLEFLRVANISSFSSTLQSYPNHCDFTGIDDGSDYLQRMTDPVHGLIPKLLLDTSAKRELYEKTHADFQEQLQLLAGKHLIVNQGQDDIQAYDMDNRLKGYIEPFGLYNDNEASPLDTRFDLQKHFQVFLDEPDSKTAIVLGRAGSGKSLFALSTFTALLKPWYEYRKGTASLPTWLPVYIQLRNYANDPEHCIENALSLQFGLTSQDIAVLKQGLNHNQRVIFICDGIDELGSGTYPNLSQSISDWPLAKVLVTGRPEHFDKDHQPLDVLSLRFPDGRMILNSAQVVYVSPFSSDEIQRYVAYHDKGKNEGTYQILQKLPGMMALLDNPFLLTLVLQSLPQLLKNREGVERAVSRTDIYQASTETWFLQATKGRELDPKACEQFSEELAFRLFKAKTLSISNTLAKKDLWDLFNSEANQAVQDASPLRFSGGEYSFVHKSIYEYFVAMRLWKAVFESDYLTFWQVRHLTEERPIIDFLSELYRASHSTEKETSLMSLIEHSRQPDFPITASSNAITVLNAARVSFSGRDLHDIRIIGADLTGAILDNTNLENTDLSNVTLAGAWLHGTNFRNALLANLALGEYPSLLLKGEVKSCCYSPDGKLLAVTVGKNIELYDSQTRDLLRIFFGHAGDVTSVHFSPDGVLLVSGSEDHTVKLWRVADGVLQCTFEGHTDYVRSVQFSSDGVLLASGSNDETVKLWQVGDGVLQRTLEGHTSYVLSVHFSPDGILLASGSEDETVKLWKVADGALQHTLKHTLKNVVSVQFSPLSKADTQLLVSGSWDGVAKYAKELLPMAQRMIEGQNSNVSTVQFSPDSTLLASGSWDGTVRFWKVADGVLQRTLEGHAYWVTSVQFSPDGMLLASGSFDNKVKVWRVADGVLQRTFEGHTSTVNSLQFSPYGVLLASGGSDNTVRLWKIADRMLLRQTLEGQSSIVRSVQFSPFGALLASGGDDNTVKIWNVNGALQRELKGHTATVNTVQFSPDGVLLASGSNDNTVKVWKVADGTLLHTLKGHTKSVNSVDFSSDGVLLASGSNDNTVKVWKVADGTLLHTLKRHTSSVHSVQFSPDGALLASGVGDDKCDDCTVKLWRVASGELQRTLEGHTSSVISIHFSWDGAFLVSSSLDKTVKIWKVTDGTLQHTLQDDHTADIRSAQFSPDGMLLASGWDNTIRIWQGLGTDKEFCYIINVSSFVRSLSFKQKATETFLMSGHDDGMVRYWKLERIDHKLYLQLVWSTGQNALLCEDANLEGVRGLSVNDIDLFKQRGAGRLPLQMAENHPDWTLIHLAVANNNREKIAQLIQANPSCLEKVTIDGSTVLHVAVRYNVNIIPYLLSQGADRLARDYHGNWPGQIATEPYQKEALNYLPIEDKETPKQTSLHLAVKGGYKQVVEWLLQQRALGKLVLQVDAVNHKGETPLLLAAAQDRSQEILKLLLGNGANIHGRNDKGETAAHIAARCDQLEMLKLLKKRGADLLAKDDKQRTAFYAAVDAKAWKVLEWLLREEISLDIDEKNDKGETAAHIVASYGQIEILKLLKKRGADLLVKANYGVGSFYTIDNDFSPFHTAVYHNQVEVIAWFLEQKVLIELKANAGQTAAHLAARGGHLETLKLLQEKGADLLARDNDGYMPIHIAAYHNQVEVIAWLLKQKVSIELKTNIGKTAAHVAAYRGHLKTLKFLKERGADLLARDNNGYMPIHTAVNDNQVEVIAWLLEQKVLIELKTDEGETATYLAARRGHLKTLKFLKERGADLLARDNDGYMPIHIAANDNRVEVIAWLLEQNVSVELKTDEGETAAYLAARRGHLKTLKFLKERGADLLARDNTGYMPIHIAANDNQVEVIAWLVEQKVSMELKNNLGKTAAHLAALRGHLETLKLLKERGADLLARDNDGYMPIHTATNNNQVEVVAWFLEQKVSMELKANEGETAAYLAARGGYLKTLKLLQEKGADLLASDNDGYMPIHIAAYDNQVEVIAWLLEQNVSMELKADGGETAAYLAARRGHLETLKFLKERGADLLVRDNDGYMPIHIAAYNNRVEVVEWLLDQSILIDILRDDDCTPLHSAAARGAKQVVELLVRRGANPNALNKDGKTPAQLAYENSEEETARLIEKSQFFDKSSRTGKSITSVSIEILDQITPPPPSEPTSVIVPFVTFSAATQELAMPQAGVLTVSKKSQSLKLKDKEEFIVIKSSKHLSPLLFQYPDSTIRRVNLKEEKAHKDELVTAFYTPF